MGPSLISALAVNGRMRGKIVKGFGLKRYINATPHLGPNWEPAITTRV